MASIISCVAFVALTFNSFAHSVALDSTSPETLVDIAYGADPKQKMDVYLPANRSTEKTPVLFLIHGGGWNSGDKSQLTPYITALQKRLPEYAFVNINYRLFNFNTGNNRFPAQEDDVKNAVRFFREKASGYKVSPNIILLGASAGGHLALLQGYKNEKPENVKAIISFFGPSDLTELYNHPANPGLPMLLHALTSTNPADNKSFYEQISPINFITSKSPPTIILQGGRDVLVPATQAILLKDRLQSLGVKHEYVYYPDEGHGWRGNNLSDSLDKIASFLNALP